MEDSLINTLRRELISADQLIKRLRSAIKGQNALIDRQSREIIELRQFRLNHDPDMESYRVEPFGDDG